MVLSLPKCDDHSIVDFQVFTNLFGEFYHVCQMKIFIMYSHVCWSRISALFFEVLARSNCMSSDWFCLILHKLCPFMIFLNQEETWWAYCEQCLFLLLYVIVKLYIYNKSKFIVKLLFLHLFQHYSIRSCHSRKSSPTSTRNEGTISIYCHFIIFRIGLVNKLLYRHFEFVVGVTFNNR